MSTGTPSQCTGYTVNASFCSGYTLPHTVTMRSPFEFDGPCTLVEVTVDVSHFIPTQLPFCSIPPFTEPTMIPRSPQVLIPQVMPAPVCHCITFVSGTFTLEKAAETQVLNIEIKRLPPFDCCDQIFEVNIDQAVPCSPSEIMGTAVIHYGSKLSLNFELSMLGPTGGTIVTQPGGTVYWDGRIPATAPGGTELGMGTVYCGMAFNLDIQIPPFDCDKVTAEVKTAMIYPSPDYTIDFNAGFKVTGSGEDQVCLLSLDLAIGARAVDFTIGVIDFAGCGTFNASFRSGSFGTKYLDMTLDVSQVKEVGKTVTKDPSSPGLIDLSVWWGSNCSFNFELYYSFPQFDFDCGRFTVAGSGSPPMYSGWLDITCEEQNSMDVAIFRHIGRDHLAYAGGDLSAYRSAIAPHDIIVHTHYKYGEAYCSAGDRGTAQGTFFVPYSKWIDIYDLSFGHFITRVKAPTSPEFNPVVSRTVIGNIADCRDEFSCGDIGVKLSGGDAAWLTKKLTMVWTTDLHGSYQTPICMLRHNTRHVFDTPVALRHMTYNFPLNCTTPGNDGTLILIGTRTPIDDFYGSKFGHFYTRVTYGSRISAFTAAVITPDCLPCDLDNFTMVAGRNIAITRFSSISGTCKRSYKLDVTCQLNNLTAARVSGHGGGNTLYLSRGGNCTAAIKYHLSAAPAFNCNDLYSCATVLKAIIDCAYIKGCVTGGYIRSAVTCGHIRGCIHAGNCITLGANGTIGAKYSGTKFITVDNCAIAHKCSGLINNSAYVIGREFVPAGCAPSGTLMFNVNHNYLIIDCGHIVGANSTFVGTTGVKCW